MEIESDEDLFITQSRYCDKTLDSDCEGNFGGFEEILSKDFQNEIDRRQLELPEVFSTKRFGGAINDDVLKEHIQCRIPKNTVRQTDWAVRIWCSWATARNSSIYYDTNDRFKSVCNEFESPNFSHEERAYWLSKCVLEISKENGEFYTPNSLMQTVCGMQRHLRENGGYSDLNIFSDGVYKKFCDSLGSKMKELSSNGIGVQLRKAEPFSYDEEETLWQTGALGTDESEQLLNTLLFLIGKSSCIRGGQEHGALKASQFIVIPATNREREKLRFTGFVDKTHQGGLKHRKFGARVVEHHAIEEKAERCVVHVFKKYMTNRHKNSPCDVLYLKPKKSVKAEDNVWYYKTAVGHNTLSSVVKKLCKKAGIPGYKTNHSLRATTATRELTWVCQTNWSWIELVTEVWRLYTPTNIQVKSRKK